MAVWALSQLVSKGCLEELERHWRSGETDEEVQAEWEAARGEVIAGAAAGAGAPQMQQGQAS
jgi:hypothetical protein